MSPRPASAWPTGRRRVTGAPCPGPLRRHKEPRTAPRARPAWHAFLGPLLHPRKSPVEETPAPQHPRTGHPAWKSQTAAGLSLRLFFDARRAEERPGAPRPKHSWSSSAIKRNLFQCGALPCAFGRSGGGLLPQAGRAWGPESIPGPDLASKTPPEWGGGGRPRPQGHQKQPRRPSEAPRGPCSRGGVAAAAAILSGSCSSGRGPRPRQWTPRGGTTHTLPLPTHPHTHPHPALWRLGNTEAAAALSGAPDGDLFLASVPGPRLGRVVQVHGGVERRLGSGLLCGPARATEWLAPRPHSVARGPFLFLVTEGLPTLRALDTGRVRAHRAGMCLWTGTAESGGRWSRSVSLAPPRQGFSVGTPGLGEPPPPAHAGAPCPGAHAGGRTDGQGRSGSLCGSAGPRAAGAALGGRRPPDHLGPWTDGTV